MLVQRTVKDARVVTRVDLTGVERDGNMDRDVELRDGDTVYVPKAREVAVLGRVNRPGSFVMPAGAPLTILGAIARAEGMTRLAKSGAVIWHHNTRKGLTKMTIDVDEILEGDAVDRTLSPGDVLFVPERMF